MGEALAVLSSKKVAGLSNSSVCCNSLVQRHSLQNFQAPGTKSPATLLSFVSEIKPCMSLTAKTCQRNFYKRLFICRILLNLH